MEIMTLVGVAAAVVLVYMTMFFIVAQVIKDNSIADIAWGPGFIVVSAAVLFYAGTFELRQLIVMGLVTIWGLRLAVRIGRRNIGHGEDWRYKKWREEWGKFFILRSYLQVFILQGAVLLLNIMPVLVIHAGEGASPGVFDYIGIGIWIIGFIFEALGDYQLDVFLKDPKNRGTIIDSGLWRYTRHPNYFGEAAMWWGIFVIALSVPGGWIGIIGPLTITLMLRFVSGVPMTERAMEDVPGFDEYRKRTNAFIPWFPGKG